VCSFFAILVEKASFDDQSNAGRRGRLHAEHCLMKDFILQANGTAHFLGSDSELSNLCPEYFDYVVGDCLVNENDVIKFRFTKEKVSDAVGARFTFKEHRSPEQKEGGDGFRTQPCPGSKLGAGAVGERGGISLHRAGTGWKRFSRIPNAAAGAQPFEAVRGPWRVKLPANCDRSA
jgi:hypothetical protein